MPTVLVTGANRGLGLEFARQYADEGWTVLACCRDPAGAAALNELQGELETLPLDVTDETRIQQLAKSLRGRPIDVLINNAGVYGPRRSEPGYAQPEPWVQVLRTNLIAPYRVSAALLDNLRTGDRKLLATVTSRMGSIADNDSGNAVIYRSSKAGLNAVMKSMALDLAEDGITVLILHPGWVHTDMGGSNALIQAEESVSGMRQLMEKTTPEQSGQFLAYDGRVIPW